MAACIEVPRQPARSQALDDLIMGVSAVCAVDIAACLLMLVGLVKFMLQTLRLKAFRRTAAA